MFIACGINHKTAPIDIREQVAFPIEEQPLLLNQFVQRSGVNEVAVLSTCNRTEIYCHTNQHQNLIPVLAELKNLSVKDIKPYFYQHNESRGVHHALRVASGLDSMMLGEPQILGQLKQAYHTARNAGTINKNLQTTFEYVFSASKRIRNNSGIGQNPVSIAFAAVQLLNKIYSQLTDLNVLIIGSGEMSTLIAKYLQKNGVTKFMVASRSQEKADLVAAPVQGNALTIGDIPQYLEKADIVISATACPLPFITKNMIQQALSKRAQKPMFLLDLAVPRDIEKDIKSLENAYLYNIDDLRLMAEKGMEERKSAAVYAERLVNYELDNYLQWHRSLKANEIICHFRSQMQEMAQLEIDRAQQKMAAGHCQTTIMNEFAARLINKMMHSPTIGLKTAATENRQDILELAKYLFQSQTEQLNHETLS